MTTFYDRVESSKISLEKVKLSNSVLTLSIMFVLAVSAGFSASEIDFEKNSNSRHNVVIIDIDRMNTDHMPCYGYDRNTTPNICEFGEENIQFKNAVSQAGWTASSVASLFTSQYPQVHGLGDHSDHLTEEAVTLAEVLNRNGYSTMAFPGYPSNTSAHLHEGYNVDQGFDSYKEGNTFIEHHMEDIPNSLNSTMEPFFLYVQTYKPHEYAPLASGGEAVVEYEVENRFRGNYTGTLHNLSLENRVTVSSIIKEQNRYQLQLENQSNIQLTENDIEYVKANYDDHLYDADKNVGEILDLLKDRGMYSDSIIILTANHGDVLDSSAFPDSARFGHGSVWEDDIRVPFMIRVPGEESRTIDQQIQLIDVFPTILEELGIPQTDQLKKRIQGEPFRPLYTGKGKYEGGSAFSTAYNKDLYAVRDNGWKLIVFPGGAKKLFNLENDPDEEYDVGDKNSKIIGSLMSDLKEQTLQNRVLKSEIYVED